MRLTETTATGRALTTRARPVLAAQRLVLRTSSWRGWRLAYELVAHVAAWAFAPRGAPVYVRGSLRSGELVPGLSDIDLAIVVPDDATANRLTERWRRVHRRVGLAALLVDRPRMIVHADLGATVTVLTADAPVYVRHVDVRRAMERPGLGEDWRHLRGPDVLPQMPPPAGHALRLHAWLEIAYWWRWAFPALVDRGPRQAAQCVKLVTGPGTAWLMLEFDERPDNRRAVLAALARRLPEHAEAIARIDAVRRTLTAAPEPPLDDALALLTAITDRVAAHLEDELADVPREEVALVGAPDDLPLLDWRGVAHPDGAGDTLAPVDGPLRADLIRNDGPYPALRCGRLLLLPGTTFDRTRLRTVQTALTDPVSFALLRGDRVARFPAVPGWSATDLARRALAEHRAAGRTSRRAQLLADERVLALSDAALAELRVR
jgi:hypothetical protein